MVPVSTLTSRQRSERRIAVRLPLKVRGRDSRGIAFEEETSSENLCRTGAAFLTRFNVALGSRSGRRIPFSGLAPGPGGTGLPAPGRVGAGRRGAPCGGARGRGAVPRPPFPALLPPQPPPLGGFPLPPVTPPAPPAA